MIITVTTGRSSEAASTSSSPTDSEVDEIDTSEDDAETIKDNERKTFLTKSGIEITVICDELIIADHETDLIAGRPVKDGGGIEPDILLPTKPLGIAERTFFNLGLYLRYLRY